jgi:hypothetical protein
MLWKDYYFSWTKGFSKCLDVKGEMKNTAEVKLPGQNSSRSSIVIDVDITSEGSATTYSSHARIESRYNSKTRPGGTLQAYSSGIGIDVDVDVDGELTATEDEAESLAESESDAGTQNTSRTLAPIQRTWNFTQY